MTQSIFLELSESFKIDITQARFSFSIVSLFYAASFFFLGAAADKFDLPIIAATGLLLLAFAVFYSSYAASFSLFIIAMALMGFCAALIPASMFPHITKTSPLPIKSAFIWDQWLLLELLVLFSAEFQWAF